MDIMDIIKIIFFFTLGFIINIFMNNNFNTKNIEGFILYKKNDPAATPTPSIKFKIIDTSEKYKIFKNIIFTGEILMETETQTLDEIKITNIRSIVFPNAPRPDDFTPENENVNFSIDGLFSLEYNKSGSILYITKTFFDGWTTSVNEYEVPIEFISDVYKVPVKIETNNDDTYFKIDKIINYRTSTSYKDKISADGRAGVSDEYFVIEILGYVNTKNIMKDQIKKYIYSTFIDIDRTIDNFN
jgi:hypothetical protein